MSLLKRSVFLRLFLGFILTAIPLYTISLGATWYGSKIVAREEERSTQEKISFFTGFVDSELANIKKMVDALNADTDVYNYVFQRNKPFSYDTYTAYSAVVSKLKMVLLSSDYLRDAFMILPRTREEISMNGSVTKLEENRTVKLPDIIGSSSNKYSYIDKDSIMYTVANNGLYIVGVEISQNKILSAIRDNQSNDMFHVLLLDKEHGNLLGTGELTPLDKEIFKRLDINDNNDVVTIDDKRYIVKKVASKENLFHVVAYAPERELLSNLYGFRRTFWILVICSIVIFLAFSFMINRQVHRPLKQLLKLIKEVENGNFDIKLEQVTNDEFGYVYRKFIEMVQRIRTLIQEVLENKIQVQKAQLKQLQSHINPHFLFNSLYLGYRMAKSGENENVAKLCKYLGDYFRFITYYSDGEVSLKDELNYTANYLNIQKLRYSNKLDFRISSDINVDIIRVPNMIIQPLVENAVLHGIEKINRPGLIEIHATRDEHHVYIDVKDNGAGMDEEELVKLQESLSAPTKDGEHYGLWNIHWRLCYQFGAESGLRIQRRDGGGVQIVIVLPMNNDLQTKKDNEVFNHVQFVNR